MTQLVDKAGTGAAEARGRPRAPSMKRITFVGSIGAGKTTLAGALGQKLGRDVVHLDDLWWEPGDYQRTPEVAKARTMERERWLQLNRELAEGDTWIIDGSLNLLAVRLARADTVVFVDLPRRICMTGVLKRWCLPLRRHRGRPRGSVRWLWVLLRWVWKYPEKRAWIVAQIAEHAPGANLIPLRSRRQVRAFIRQVDDSHRATSRQLEGDLSLASRPPRRPTSQGSFPDSGPDLESAPLAELVAVVAPRTRVA